MLPGHYSELASAGVERQVLFGTDFPIQGGFNDWLIDDVSATLEDFYRRELDAVQAAGYSKDVMSLNFKRYLGI
jgi:hypothetical protein